jgi:hypothetical protein
MTSVMGTWLAIVFGLLALPLTAFSQPLSRLKNETLAATGAQASRRSRRDAAAL